MLPCQQTFLSTREDFPTARIYACAITMTAAAIYGPGPDEEMLMEVCQGCKESPTNRHKLSGGALRQVDAHIRGQG